MQRVSGTDVRAGSLRQCGGVEVAPYVIVRAAAFDTPPELAAVRDLRHTQDAIVTLLAEARTLAPALTDALYRLCGEAPAAYRQSVLLPVRRDIHNGRSPRPALRGAVDTLAGQVPGLARWLAIRDGVDRLAAELDAGREAALRAERVALAGLCVAEPLARAVALTSPDLWAAIRRTAAHGGTPDSRDRKSEPTVLRYALRPITRTSPLSWFTAVGWARLPGASAASIPVPPGRCAVDIDAAGEPVAVTRPPVGLVASIFHAATGEPDRLLRTPHRLAPGFSERDTHVQYYRERPDTGADQQRVLLEERVRLPRHPALAAVVRLLRESPADLPAGELVAAICGRSGGDRQRHARRIVRQLRDERMLVAVPPTDEHDPKSLAALADWLAGTGAPELAAELRLIDHDVRALADLGAGGRGPAVRSLDDAWRRVLRAVGSDASPHVVATEDVVFPRPARLDRSPVDETDLAVLTRLAALFDRDHEERRALRHRFLRRYGPGGRCADISGFVEELRVAGGDTDTAPRVGERDPLDPLGPADSADPELAQLVRLRRQVVESVRTGDGEAWLPRGLAVELPQWTRVRPASYSFFGMPAPDGTFVLNQVHGGWGRFTSRFLDFFGDGELAAAVSGQLRRILRGRGVQYRPVHGFNANLHPLLLDEEVGDDPRRCGLDPSGLDLVHDPRTDQIRLCDRATGDPLDVLYLGFLIPPALPARVAALLGDLGSAMVWLAALAPARTVTGPGGNAVVRERLRCGQVVISRRSWWFDGPAAAQLGRASAAASPLAAVAELRAAWGLPDQVFLSQRRSATAAADPLRAARARPKPQFVDLASPLHLRCLPRWLERIDGQLVIEEALPRPGGHATPARLVELILETYLPAVAHG